VSTLREMFVKNCEGLDPISRALKVHRGLKEATEFHRSVSPLDQELVDYEMGLGKDAAELLMKLGLEVTRLRLGIQHYEVGRLDKRTLCLMAQNWNGETNG